MGNLENMVAIDVDNCKINHVMPVTLGCNQGEIQATHKCLVKQLEEMPMEQLTCSIVGNLENMVAIC